MFTEVEVTEDLLIFAANLPLNMVRVKGGLKTTKVNNPSLKHVSFWFACHRILWQ